MESVWARYYYQSNINWSKAPDFMIAIEQSSTAMLAQANASVYEVLTLIPD